MLDENWGFLQEQDSADTNSYTLGRIGMHNVAIACLPQYGTISAAIVANNMIRTFSKSLRIGLMVGVGGGIPSATHDIRLGDIVISYPEGTCGGVLQHNMGKVEQSGEFRRTGSLDSPPRSLLTAVSNLRGAFLTDDPRYPEYLKTAINRTARTRKNFSRPDPKSDRLFKVEHGHPSNATECDGWCSPEWEEIRPERDDSDPQLHYGIIASGNTVIKDGQTREQLGQETGTLCFEMEAAGLMLDFPCIVIRGICDYADSHKNKQWQGYAALAAAAYAKELLGYVPRGHISQEKLVKDVCRVATELENINRGLKRRFDQQEDHHREYISKHFSEQQQRCHQAFKTSIYEQYKNINPDRVEGTCQWVLKNAQYLRWLESKCSDLLWISADPGCGKSVLAKSLIDNDFKASSSTVSICYFFFKDNDTQNRLATALCAVLHQLFAQRPQLLKHALPYWQKNGDRVQQEVDELWRIFMAATSDPESSSDTICVFDALDECCDIDQGRLIQRLGAFHRGTYSSSQATRLKFLVTSRPYDSIKEGFQTVTRFFPHIHLQGEIENNQIRDEINLVVKIRVEELAKTLSLRPEEAEDLEQRLLQMEHRTYLWLYLAMDDIRTTFRNSLRPNKEKIRLIPGSVNEAYEKILSRVPSYQGESVRKILQIITAARRPLTFDEMAMALGIAISPSSQTGEEARLDVQGLDRKIRHLCGLFVYISDTRIYLIHQTAREFLLCRHFTGSSLYHFELGDAESQMAEICVRYLVMHDLEDSRAQEMFNVQCLLGYAAIYWPDHVRNMSSLPEPRLMDVLFALYNTTKSRLRLWFPLFWRPKIFWSAPLMINWPEEPPKMSAIHLAAFNGHISILQALTTAYTGDIDQPDSSGITALMYSCGNGHYDAVDLLLAKGADANYWRPLWRGGNPTKARFASAPQAASERGYDDVVEMLLENGSGPNPHGICYRTALQIASEEGHDDIVEMLLKNGADPNAQRVYGGTALQIASREGYNDIVKILLKNGADPNAQGVYCGWGRSSPT
ncbi:hypothetical protein DTO271D3_479 [Paecilomyces variotii]|nr:hypothetical protein DTO271D3_479 [Paecilomyces variotii]